MVMKTDGWDGEGKEGPRMVGFGGQRGDVRIWGLDGGIEENEWMQKQRDEWMSCGMKGWMDGWREE